MNKHVDIGAGKVYVDNARCKCLTWVWTRQYAVVKMRLFARVLCLEGHEDLAADATAAYHRLVEKVAPPPVRPISTTNACLDQ